MPLLDKERSLLDNVSDVAEKHKKLILTAMILRWMTKNKAAVLFILFMIFAVLGALFGI